MRLYFAHPVTDYGTERQAEAIATLSKSWQVVNPDTPEHQAGYAAEGMPYFERLVSGCDLLAFMRFPDGSIGAGVGREILAAQEAGVRWILEYFQGQTYPVYGQPTPILSVSQTRELIARLRSSPIEPVGLPDVCGMLVQYLSDQQVEGRESWRDRLDNALADIRTELATANDDEEGPAA